MFLFFLWINKALKCHYHSLKWCLISYRCSEQQSVNRKQARSVNSAFSELCLKEIMLLTEKKWSSHEGVSVHPSVCLFAWGCVCPSIGLSVCMRVCLSIHPSVCSHEGVSVHPSLCLFTWGCVCLSIRLSLSECLSVCLYVCLSLFVCPSVPQPGHRSLSWKMI